MSEQSYRDGFHDGWFFDGDDVVDMDYEKGVVDGKKARLESDEKERQKKWNQMEKA